MRQLKIFKSITNRESESLERYLLEISKYKLLTLEEEALLAQRTRKGDTDALNQLVRANLRFVVSVAKQYQNQGLSLSDLINEGNVGLLKAAARFDERRGFKFISYAVWWIRQTILQSLAESSRLIRLPLNQVNLINKINRMNSTFVQEYERLPSVDEMAEALNVSKEKVQDTLRSANRLVSVDTPTTPNNPDDGIMIDTLVGSTAEDMEQPLIDESLHHDLQCLLSQLGERERSIVKMYYGIGGPEQSIDEISRRVGYTKDRVRQVKERAILQLRRHLKEASFKGYL